MGEMREHDPAEKENLDDEEDSPDLFDEGPEKLREAEVMGKIQQSVRDTFSSTSLSLDAAMVARGATLGQWDCNDADEGQPRTVSSKARFYSPVANGRHVDVIYENHCRVRQSFTERDSFLWIRKGGVGYESEQDENDDSS